MTIGAAAGLAAAVVLGWWLVQRAADAVGTSPSVRSTAPAFAPDRIAVAPFADRTGDSTLTSLGVVAADWLAQELSRIAAVRVVPVTSTLAATRMVGAGSATPADPVRNLAEATGAAVVVSGSVLERGDSLILQATITDARRQQVGATVEPIVVPRRQAIEGVELLRRQVVGALASLMDVRSAATPTQVSTKPGWETYREYALGLERFVASDWTGAAFRFRRAAALDTAFPMPLLMAAIAFGNLGDLPATDSLLRRIGPRREALTPYAAAQYDGLGAWLRGDHAAAYEAARRAGRLAPGTIAHARLAIEALALNRPREALRILDSLDATRGELRGFVPYWTSRATAYHMLGEYAAEFAAARQARALHPGSLEVRLLELRGLAALGRCARITSRMDADIAGLESSALRALANECAAHGDDAAARALSARALAVAREAAHRDPRSATALAVIEAYAAAGDLEAAASLADSLLFMEAYDVDLRARRGLIAAGLGDGGAALAADEWLTRPRPGRDYGRTSLWRARLAAARGDVRATIGFLDRAAREGMPLDRPFHADPDLLPVRSSPAFKEWLRPKG